MAQPTYADAELILKLYDARREAEIRKARQWWTGTFWPESADDIVKVMRSLGSPENAWLRQVLGYWSMASSFVSHGVLNEDLFFEPSFSGEMFFIYAKVEPFLKELREKLQNPMLLANIEKLVHSQKGQERYKVISNNVENLRKARVESMAKAV
ncbi:MAG: hypothetical protein DMG81_12620 [Acidobacteria bacterium]|nr:MAG: hypothetical protein DMG81_12620 [Acidobacteriota bacterium]